MACGRAARASSRMRSGGKRAHGQVVVARPAEAAQVRAATHDLDEDARSEFGIGREDDRCRRIEPLRGLHGSLPDDRWRTGLCGSNAAMVPSPFSADVVERWDVEPALASPAFASSSPRSCACRRRRDQRGREHFAFAGGNHVGKGGQRLGVHERHGAADHDERVARGPPLGTDGNSRQAQHRDDVRVVPFERHREGEHVEVADGRIGLERAQGCA